MLLSRGCGELPVPAGQRTLLSTGWRGGPFAGGYRRAAVVEHPVEIAERDSERLGDSGTVAGLWRGLPRLPAGHRRAIHPDAPGQVLLGVASDLACLCEQTTFDGHAWKPFPSMCGACSVAPPEISNALP
ncbi:MAG TPA: hypothetical protein VFO16_17765 [Pseudonocardiaceae bacterium]|nr:hypothetical protein [Pseudonocardiaceae bacterium]